MKTRSSPINDRFPTSRSPSVSCCCTADGCKAGLSNKCNAVGPEPPSGWRSQLGATTFQRSALARVPDGSTFHPSSVSGASTSGLGARSGSMAAVGLPLVALTSEHLIGQNHGFYLRSA
jgi:hypothetical protein